MIAHVTNPFSSVLALMLVLSECEALDKYVPYPNVPCQGNWTFNSFLTW